MLTTQSSQSDSLLLHAYRPIQPLTQSCPADINAWEACSYKLRLLQDRHMCTYTHELLSGHHFERCNANNRQLPMSRGVCYVGGAGCHPPPPELEVQLRVCAAWLWLRGVRLSHAKYRRESTQTIHRPRSTSVRNVAGQ